MRAVFLFFLAVTVRAQVAFDVPRDERLDIEIVPVVVTSFETAGEIVAGDGEAMLAFMSRFENRFADVFLTTREALSVLGVNADTYNLYLGDRLEMLLCSEASTLTAQSCAHLELGQLADLPNFVYDLYDQQPPPQGTVQLSVVLLEDEIAWRGILGLAWRWKWGTVDHWTTYACRAWGLHSVPVLAHELGHCFGLVHNENDTNTGLDLMVSHYSHYEWVKESNKEAVRNHFRTLLEPVVTGASPTVELHY